MPTFDILYFIEKKMGKITINLIECFQDAVKIVGIEHGQPFVIEIDIGKFDAGFFQG